MPKQPNIVLIMADQVNPSFLPMYGHAVVKMPNLEEIAADGVVFDTAYCTSPICAPSRFSMLTGRLASELKVFDHGCEMPASAPTLMHYLRLHGYHTSLSGKMHFLGPDQLHGYEERLTTDIYPSDFGWGARLARRHAGDSLGTHRNQPTHGLGRRGRVHEACSLTMTRKWRTRRSRRSTTSPRRPEPQPFFLTVSFSQPHSPFVASQEHWDRYNDDDIDMPAVPPLPLEQMDTHSRRLHYMFHMDEYTVTDSHVRNARRAYYGMLSYIDDKIGELMTALTESGLIEDTLIVFTSDHGEMLGERGLWYKQSLLDGSVRVPLIVRIPGGSACRHVSQAVSLLDLLPTFVELASEETPTDYVEPIAGHSLLPWLSSDDSNQERPVFSEYSAEGTFAPCLMVRKGIYKYIYCETDPPLLFNLEADPDELDNLAGDESCSDILSDMHDELLRVWDPEQYRSDALASQKRQRFIHRVQSETAPNPWVFPAILRR